MKCTLFIAQKRRSLIDLLSLQGIAGYRFIFAQTWSLNKQVNDVANIKNVGFQKGEALEKLIRESTVLNLFV